MPQPEEQVKTPEVGQKFYTPSLDEGDGDEEHEIDEVLEYNADDDEWNVSADGDFFDIQWIAESQRWEEVV